MKLDLSKPPPPWLMMLALFCFILAQFLHRINAQDDLKEEILAMRIESLKTARIILSRNPEDQSARDYILRH